MPACVVMEGFSEETDIKAENYHAKQGNGVARGGNRMCKDLEKEGNLEKHRSQSRQIVELGFHSPSDS